MNGTESRRGGRGGGWFFSASKGTASLSTNLKMFPCPVFRLYWKNPSYDSQPGGIDFELTKKKNSRLLDTCLNEGT